MYIDIRAIRLSFMQMIISMFSMMSAGHQIKQLPLLESIADRRFVSLWPLAQITGISYATLMIICMSALKASQPGNWFTMTPFLIMIVNCILMHKYYRLVVRLCVDDDRAQHTFNMLLVWATLTYFSIMPTILTSDSLTFLLFSFLWLPQIIKNFYYKPTYHIYEIKFVIIQTLQWSLFVFEARSGGPTFDTDSDYSAFKLRPHPQMVAIVLSLLVVQVCILSLQKFITARSMMILANVLPRRFPFRAQFLRRMRKHYQQSQGNNLNYYRKFKSELDYQTIPQTEGVNIVSKEDDCVICLNQLKYEPLPSDSAADTEASQR